MMEQKKVVVEQKRVWVAGRSDLTLVTALYDIGREKEGDGRSFSDYLRWFEATLSIQCAMVIFVSAKHKEFVEKARRKMMHLTLVVTQELHEIPQYKYLPFVQKLIKDQTTPVDQLLGKLVATKDLVHRLPLYSIVIYSKFGWLKRAIKLNAFQSKCFLWIDAGISRFAENFDQFKKHPAFGKFSQTWIDEVSDSNRIWMQATPAFNQLIKTNEKNSPARGKIDGKELIGQRSQWLYGGVFGGSPKALKWLIKHISYIWFEQMLKKKRFHTEEVAMAMLALHYTNRFQLVIKQPTSFVQKIAPVTIPFNADVLKLITKKTPTHAFHFK